MAVILEAWFSNSLFRIIAWALTVQLLSGDCYKTSMVRSQHWLRWWLGATRQQVITWANADSDPWFHMPPLGHNVLSNDLVPSGSKPYWLILTGILWHSHESNFINGYECNLSHAWILHLSNYCISWGGGGGGGGGERLMSWGKGLSPDQSNQYLKLMLNYCQQDKFQKNLNQNGIIFINSLRPSDAYLRRYTNHHWFR